MLVVMGKTVIGLTPSELRAVALTVLRIVQARQAGGYSMSAVMHEMRIATADLVPLRPNGSRATWCNNLACQGKQHEFESIPPHLLREAVEYWTNEVQVALPVAKPKGV